MTATTSTPSQIARALHSRAFWQATARTTGNHLLRVEAQIKTKALAKRVRKLERLHSRN